MSVGRYSSTAHTKHEYAKAFVKTPYLLVARKFRNLFIAKDKFISN